MAKGILYAAPRTAERHEKADYARALQIFQSTGDFTGDPVLVAYVVTYCFDRFIPFEWFTRLGIGRDVSVIRRKCAP